MIDYSEVLIKLMAAIKIYRQLVLKGRFDEAAEAALDMQILSNELQQWTEDQCIETKSS